MLKVCQFKNLRYLCTCLQAQMAESVDALVSNTSGAIRAGSTPALGTREKPSIENSIFGFSLLCTLENHSNKETAFFTISLVSCIMWKDSLFALWLFATKRLRFLPK